MRRRDALFFTLIFAACDHKTPEPRPSTPAAPPPPLAPIASDTFARPAVPKIVAIGDLHGDLEAAKRALRLAGAIDTTDTWIGGTLVVVQTGDLIDRGDDDRKILDFVEKVRAAARKAGGDLVLLNGNHELMNAEADFRYVTPGGFAAFADLAPRAAASSSPLDAGRQGRTLAFAPGGPYARRIADHPVIAVIGDDVFAHGGVLPKHVDYGIDRINDDVRAWLTGEKKTPPAIVLAEDGPVWTRVYSGEGDACTLVDKTLAMLGKKRMIVGHTVQEHGITSACEKKVWRIDVGLARFYGGKTEVLVLQGDDVAIRRASP